VTAPHVAHTWLFRWTVGSIGGDALNATRTPFWPCQRPWAALHDRAVRAKQLSIYVARLPAIRTKPGVQINLGPRGRSSGFLTIPC